MARARGWRQPISEVINREGQNGCAAGVQRYHCGNNQFALVQHFFLPEPEVYYVCRRPCLQKDIFNYASTLLHETGLARS